jgi:hypothetical protein
MKNCQIIFKIIRKHDGRTGMPDKKCYEELERLAPSNSLFFPLRMYLRVLRGLGLIKLSGPEGAIILTQKGKTADYRSLFGFRAFILLSLHCTVRIFSVIFLLILFWPMHLSVQRHYEEKRDDEGSACGV